MPHSDEQWPGKVEEYRALLESAGAAEDRGDTLAMVGLAIAAQIAGLTQVLDKIAYNSRGGRH